MKQKLTLTVDAEVVTQIKRTARQRGSSVSSMFEKWARTQQISPKQPTLSEQLMGTWNEARLRDLAKTDGRIAAILEKHTKHMK